MQFLIGCFGVIIVISVIFGVGVTLLTSLNMEKEFYILAGVFVIISAIIKYLFYQYGAPKLQTFFKFAVGIVFVFLSLGFLTQPALNYEANQQKEKAIRAEKEAAEQEEKAKKEAIEKEEQAKKEEERMAKERERQKNAPQIIGTWCQNVRAKIADMDEQMNYHYPRITSGINANAMDSAYALNHNLEMYLQEFMTNDLYAIPDVGSSEQQDLMKEIKMEVRTCMMSRSKAASYWIKFFEGKDIDPKDVTLRIQSSNANLVRALSLLSQLEGTLK